MNRHILFITKDIFKVSHFHNNIIQDFKREEDHQLV
jgi:hypothetical protein